MAFNNIPASSLSRFSAGEITQLIGTPNFYNAGSSKWLRTGTYTAATNLNATTKANLAAASTQTSFNVALLTAYESSLTSAYPYMPLPAQRISASGVTVIQGCSGSTTPIVTTVTSAGAQNVSLPITVATASNASGGNIMVASNNTTIFAYGMDGGGTSLVAASTTDGINWSSVTLTGLPTFTDISSAKSFGSGNNQEIGGFGRRRYGLQRFGIFWCGARFLMVVGNGTPDLYIASTSTNGIAWSGNTTTTIFGGAPVGSANLDFYRNGNNCYLNVGSIWRYSNDGGVTWANTATNPMGDTAGNYQKVNADTPAKFFYADGSLNARFTSDSGVNWSSRQLPLSSNLSSSLAYKGSTVLQSRSTIAYRSVNDGATWTPIIFPVGTLASGGAVFADANRFYFCPNNQGQILTSTDGITWTIISLPSNSFSVSAGVPVGGIISYDSNNVVLMGYNGSSGTDICALTTDGGVTWKNTAVTNIGANADFTATCDAFVTPDGGGTTAFGGSAGGGYYGGTTGNICGLTTVTAGGGFYRTGSAVVTPTNANAVMFARVE